MNSPTKHTAGPWHVGVKQADQIVYNSAGWAVANATVYHGKQDLEETKANARLIAASPQMLDALMLIERACAPGVDQSDDEIENFIALVRETTWVAIDAATKSTL